MIEREKTIKQLPVLAIAFDNSQSVKSYESSFNKFKESLSDRFSNEYQLEFWAFGKQPEKTKKFHCTDRR